MQFASSSSLKVTDLGFKLLLLLLSTACLDLISEITSNKKVSFLSAYSFLKNYSALKGGVYLNNRFNISNTDTTN